MKNSTVRIVLGIIVLVLCGALEDMLPKVLGVGLPLMLIAVQFYSVRRPSLEANLFAVAAGGFVDSLAGLPLMTSASYFLAVAVLVKWVDVPATVTVLTYPAYQLWLLLWVPKIEGGVFARMLISVPMGIMAAFALTFVLGWIDRKVAVDDEG